MSERENKKTSHNLVQSILELVYPSFCEICGVRIKSNILCKSCSEKLELVADKGCPKCGASVSVDHVAQRCSSCSGKKMTFKSCVALGTYRGILRDLIILFKFHKRRYIGSVLAAMMSEKLLRSGQRFDVLVPVPAKRKLFESRYNQSEVLTRCISAKLKLPVDTSLVKIRNTRPQVELTEEERHINPRGAFQVRGNSFRDKRVLLIDDVLTTGATASECTDALIRAGTLEVYLTVIARD